MTVWAFICLSVTRPQKGQQQAAAGLEEAGSSECDNAPLSTDQGRTSPEYSLGWRKFSNLVQTVW